MSEADRKFNKLGYKKYTSDDGTMYMKDLFMITFILPNKTFITEYKQGDYNFPKIRPFEVSMQELQAINEKCKELRMDMKKERRKYKMKESYKYDSSIMESIMIFGLILATIIAMTIGVVICKNKEIELERYKIQMQVYGETDGLKGGEDE